MSSSTPPSAKTSNALDALPSNTDSFEVTVRFSASIPDLPLSVPSNNATPPTTAVLKQLIRGSLPTDLKNKRIRLIYAGKSLDDATPLSNTLKRTVSRPPSRVATPGPYDPTTEDAATKAKGKLAVRDPPASRIYIHCSIGDVTLSKPDLDAEAAQAYPPKTTTTSANGPSPPENSNKTASYPQDAPSTTTTTAAAGPRGFDRLLTTGFSREEVANLRLQFMSIQSHTHTPDTMPSPTTLRALEDQWLDNSGSSGFSLDPTDAAAGGVSGGGGGGFADEDGNRGALDDMIWGTTTGFFWPIGCLVFGLREEGIFSPRRKIAIVVGVLLNLGLGFIRWGG